MVLDTELHDVQKHAKTKTLALRAGTTLHARKRVTAAAFVLGCCNFVCQRLLFLR